VRPPKNRELPLQLKATWCVTGNKVELRADILVPGFTSRKLGQIPCEDVSVRFPIPECWIYLFRVEKHFRWVFLAMVNKFFFYLMAYISLGNTETDTVQSSRHIGELAKSRESSGYWVPWTRCRSR